jgi:hypothetical protein
MSRASMHNFCIVLLLSAAGVARAQVTAPLTVTGTLTIQGNGTNNIVQYTNGTVSAGTVNQTLSQGLLVIRGGKAQGAACASGAECWTTDFCEDGVCCCHCSPGNTVINGQSTVTCYGNQYLPSGVTPIAGSSQFCYTYAAATVAGDYSNAPGNLFQCGNCAACNLPGSVGVCAAAAKARYSGAGVATRTSTTCRPPVTGSDGSTCDIPEVCNGASPTCPADSHYAAGTGPLAGGLCRVAAGTCDIAATCPGGTGSNSVVCPTNVLYGVDHVCLQQNLNGVCNGQQKCLGNSAFCPAPPPAAVGLICRPAQGQCDVTDRCDGRSNSCVNSVIAAGVQCDPSGVQCSGSSPYCTNASGGNVGYGAGTCL